MLLRVFTRTTAERVQPRDVIEKPKALRVEEVVNGLDGIRLVGFTPKSTKARSTVEVKRGDPVELPVSDPDSVSALLVQAFQALRTARQEDEDDSFDYSWNHTTGEFVVTRGSESIIIAVDPQAHEAKTAVPATEPAPVKAAAKKAT